MKNVHKGHIGFVFCFLFSPPVFLFKDNIYFSWHLLHIVMIHIIPAWSGSDQSLEYYQYQGILDSGVLKRSLIILLQYEIFKIMSASEGWSVQTQVASRDLNSPWVKIIPLVFMPIYWLNRKLNSILLSPVMDFVLCINKAFSLLRVFGDEAFRMWNTRAKWAEHAGRQMAKA